MGEATVLEIDSRVLLGKNLAKEKVEGSGDLF